MSVKPPPELLIELIRRLKVLRESQGLTLQEVYDATGIHIARIEAQRLNVTITTLAVLASHYKTTLAELLAGIEATSRLK